MPPTTIEDHRGNWLQRHPSAAPIAWLLVATSIAGAAIGLSVPAHASPIDNYAAINAGPICATLDDYPTVAGVTGILQGIRKDSGFTAYQSGQVVATAVSGWCPEHLGVLQRFVDVYSDGNEVL